MTYKRTKSREGMIQKVCNKYISNDALTYEAKNTAYQIEQDLIAEIKKMKTTEGDFYDNGIYVDRKELIGEE